MATFKKKVTWEMLKRYDTKIKAVIAKNLPLAGGTITDGEKEMKIMPDGITGDDSQVLSKFNKLQASQFEGNIVTLRSKNSTIPFYLENVESGKSNSDGTQTYTNTFRLYDDNNTILKYISRGDTLETPFIVKAGGLNITHNTSSSSYKSIKTVIKTSASGFTYTVDSTANDGTKYSHYIKTSNSKLSVKGADFALDSDKNITMKTANKISLTAWDFEYSGNAYSSSEYPHIRMTSSMIQTELGSCAIRMGINNINLEAYEFYLDLKTRMYVDIHDTNSDYTTILSSKDINGVGKIRLGTFLYSTVTDPNNANLSHIVYEGTGLVLGKDQITLGHSSASDKNFSGFTGNIKSSIVIKPSSIVSEADDFKFNDNNKTQMFRIKNNAITLREKISLKYNEDNESLDFVFAS